MASFKFPDTTTKIQTKTFNTEEYGHGVLGPERPSPVEVTINAERYC